MHLALWAAALATGIAVAVAAVPWAIALLAASAALASISLARLRAWAWAMVLFALLSGLWLGWREVRLATMAPAVEENRWVEVTGKVQRGPDVEQPPDDSMAEATLQTEQKERARARYHFRVVLENVDGRPVHGILSLVVLAGPPMIGPGDWVRFPTRLYLPRGFADPGLPDARLLARGQGIDYVATVRDAADFRRIDGSTAPLDWARSWAARMRAVMAGAINARLREPAAGFVRTMVIGERSDVPEATEDGFRAAGATHVLSVSGLHLAVVVALFFHVATWLLTRHPSWSLRVPAKTMASLLSLPACLFYTLLTGEAVATVRSAIMAAMLLGANIVNRPASLAAGVAAAAIILLVESPLALLDLSFQLSFASVIGLALFSRWLLVAPGKTSQGRWQRIRGWLLRSFSASIAASLVTSPLVAHHFGEITPAAPLGNLILVPIVELVVLPCGLVGALLGIAHPWLGAVPLLAAGVASRLALMLAEVFRRLAPVLLVCCPDWTETFLLVGAAAALLQAFAGSTGRRRWWLALAGGLATVAGTSLIFKQVDRLRTSDLRVTFLDVGQGDSTLIEGPGGFVALVDGGGRYDNRFDTGARIVEPVLRARGITKLDLVVLSHPHPDHMNGLFRILRRFPTAALWQSGDDGHNPAFHELLSLARARGISIPTPNIVEANGLRFEAISPWQERGIAPPAGLDANDASLVVRLSYAGRQVLLTGDIGGAGEAELLEHRKPGSILRSEIVKVPHHGSKYASSARLIDVVSPDLAVASAGRFNSFGLPNAVALRRYADREVEVLRTDRDGAVTVVVNRAGALSVVCARGCSRRARPD